MSVSPAIFGRRWKCSRVRRLLHAPSAVIRVRVAYMVSLVLFHQVSVEPIIEDVVNGRIRPEDIIRSQHETLSQNMAQQASTLQSLVSLVRCAG